MVTMKTHLIIIILVFYFMSCKKKIESSTMDAPVNLVGKWYVSPVGLSGDSFRYKVVSDMHPENAFIPDLYLAGKVTSGNVIVHLVENSSYTLFFKDSTGINSSIHRITGNDRID